jgi:hypothetical protein
VAAALTRADERMQSTLPMSGRCRTGHYRSLCGRQDQRTRPSLSIVLLVAYLAYLANLTTEIYPGAMARITRAKKTAAAKKAATGKITPIKSAGKAKKAAGTTKEAASRKLSGTSALSQDPAGREARAAAKAQREARAAAKAQREARSAAHDQRNSRRREQTRQSFAARARDTATAVATLLLEADPDEAVRIRDVAEQVGSGDSLDPQLWGTAPSRADIAAGMLANLRKRFELRRAVAAASLSRAEVAELLGTSEQTVTDYLEVHRLLGFKEGRRWVIPAWQLDPDTERGVLPGIERLGQTFPGGVLALTQWVTRPSAQFDGHTPRDLLVKGEVAAVTNVAEQLTAVGW